MNANDADVQLDLDSESQGGVAVEAALDAGATNAELDALVARFGHRVRYFAKRIERRFGLDPAWRDDLVSAGYYGLLKALRNRRADAHDHELSAYVSMRVEGAVLDEARQVLERVALRADFDPSEVDDGFAVDLGAAGWMGCAASDPEDTVDGWCRWRRIEGSFDQLDADHKRWLMALATGHSLAEIARRDGASPARLQNQMSRISRAVRAQVPDLRRLLRHEI